MLTHCCSLWCWDDSRKTLMIFNTHSSPFSAVLMQGFCGSVGENQVSTAASMVQWKWIIADLISHAKHTIICTNCWYRCRKQFPVRQWEGHSAVAGIKLKELSVKMWALVGVIQYASWTFMLHEIKKSLWHLFLLKNDAFFSCLVCFHYFVCCYGGCSLERKWALGGWVVARKQIFMGIAAACFSKESYSLTHCRLQRFRRVWWLSRWCTFYLFYTSKWWLQKIDIWVIQNGRSSTANKPKHTERGNLVFLPFPLWPLPYMWYYTEDLGRQYISVKKKWING